MALLVKLYSDVAVKETGIPDGWPAEVTEVPDGTPDPKDGRLVMKDVAELEAYKVGQKAAYDVWRADLDLPALKETACRAIDARTAKLIEQGYSYGGQQLSLSAMAQVTLLGLDQVRNDPAFKFPVVLNALGDTDTYTVTDADDAHNLFLTAVATYRKHKDDGTALKNQVRAAASKAELDAVVDDR